jgi:hypothetical protein
VRGDSRDIYRGKSLEVKNETHEEGLAAGSTADQLEATARATVLDAQTRGYA